MENLYGLFVINKKKITGKINSVKQSNLYKFSLDIVAC